MEFVFDATGVVGFREGDQLFDSDQVIKSRVMSTTLTGVPISRGKSDESGKGIGRVEQAWAAGSGHGLTENGLRQKSVKGCRKVL